jgi:hypothetical protein
MTESEVKASIVLQLTQQSLDIAVNRLAQIVVENDSLKKKIAELEAPKPAATD